MYVLNTKPALLASSYFTEAIATVNRPVATWFKGYLSILATLSTYRRKHLAGGPVATVPMTLRLPGLATRHTAFGVVGVASGCEELLFVSAEGEGSSAVGTLDGLVLKAHWMTSFYK
jgi:hypothetical protein